MTFGHFKRLLLFLFFFKVDFNNNKVNFFNDFNNIFLFNFRVDFDNGFLDRSDNSLSNRIGRTARGGNTPIERFRRKSQKLKKRKLVFIEDSPDYCRKNATAGKYFHSLFKKVYI